MGFRLTSRLPLYVKIVFEDVLQGFRFDCCDEETHEDGGAAVVLCVICDGFQKCLGFFRVFRYDRVGDEDYVGPARENVFPLY
jgi:hypothetical protein